ncbi:MAG: DUF5640 domain-containing protein [Bacillota bacterium]
MKKKSAILILVLCASLLLVACSGSTSSIVGKWKDEASGMSTWEFKGDGTMSMTALGQTVSGTYKTDGDKITMTIAGDEGTGTFKIEGNKLTLTDPSNSTTVLVKQ